jgi:hypothetical protein
MQNWTMLLHFCTYQMVESAGHSHSWSTELDVPVPANRDEPQNCYDLHKQGLMYRA